MTEALVLTNARLIGLTGGRIIPEGYIRIQAGYLNEIGSMEQFKVADNEKCLDLAGKSVLPGLIDSHCHLISENAYPVSEPYIVRSTIAGVRAARLALESGLTSVRDVGCRHLGIYALHSAVYAGEVPGPRFQTAGRPLAGTGISETWRSYSHDGSDEMLRGVRNEWQQGANWIKVSVSDGRWRPTRGWHDTPLVTPEEINAIVVEAHSKDMRVACHVDGPAGAKLAIEARVDSIEHGVSIPDNLLSRMAELGIVFVPTIWIYSTQDLKVFKADLTFLNDLHADTIRRARAAGVKIAAGVDFSYLVCPPMEGLANELSALVARGLPEMEAIQSATVRGAELLGWEDFIGTLSAGKLADMVVIDGDPQINIEALKRVVLVIQHGRIIRDLITNSQDVSPCPLPELNPSWMSRSRIADQE
jgi:imidazolonepropionase-like amidohydrolase